MTIQTAVLVALLSLFGISQKKENPLLSVESVFVDGDGPAQSYLRQQLEPGYQCLELAPGRKSADAILALYGTETATRGMLGEKKNYALLSGLLQGSFGQPLWDFTKKTPGKGLEKGLDQLLKQLARDCGCKKRMKEKGDGKQPGSIT